MCISPSKKKRPNSTQFYAVTNRLSFAANEGNTNPNVKSSRLSPIQKFRWVHFPFHPGLQGNYTYRVTPVFMDGNGILSYGDHQQADIQLENETYPGALNIAFTRGFVSSQAFEDRFSDGNATHALLPSTKDDPLAFVSQNPQAQQAYAWMGLEARQVILSLLDAAIADTTAEVVVTAYDLDLKELVDRLVLLGPRLRIIIDSSTPGHGDADSPETAAQTRLEAAKATVQRQKVMNIQHNKYIAVSGNVQQALGGSTNFSWRGFYIQNNNAVLVHGASQVQQFFAAFDTLWANKDTPGTFVKSGSASWQDLAIPGVGATIAFSPHGADNACLQGIGNAIGAASSSLLYSLAFLYQTGGPVHTSIATATANKNLFVYGISDKGVDGLELQVPDGNPPVAFPAGLADGAVADFKGEPSIGSGIHMHHKFVVIDFEKPTARVYTGSYNFSGPADLKNGENLWLFQDRRIAVAYTIEALAMFDHYEWRDAVAKAKEKGIALNLAIPPASGQQAWWAEDYTVPLKIRDRILFSQ